MTKSQLQNHVQIWCDLCKRYYGVYPMIYSSREFYRKYLKGRFSRLYFWCGDVDASRQYVDGEKWMLWQHKIDRLPGVHGKVDINVMNPKYDLKDISM